MKNIAIVGAGQLGSRHLQALARIEEKVVLYIVDPNNQSLQISKERFQEVNEFKKELVCLNRVTDLPKSLEFVVISTNSKQRLAVLKEILTHSEVKYLLLEKFLFPKIEEYEEATKALEKTSTIAYVNCARKIWPAYQSLKDVVDISSRMVLKVVGTNWGLASNAIHFLNLFLYLTDETEVTIDTSTLDSKLLENKRAGYVEFTGTLKAITASQHKLILTSNLGENGPTVITINCGTQNIEIHELEQFMYINDEKKDFFIHHQSSLTNKVYEQLIATGDCSLVSYKQSVTEHIMLLQEFNVFLGNREGAIT